MNKEMGTINAITNLIKLDGYVIFAPTYRCNLNCEHCNLISRNKKTDELSLNEISNIFSRSDLLRNINISISGGEPFLREDIIEIIKIILSKKDTVSIITNGTLTERIEDFVNASIDSSKINFSFSLDGIGDVHDSIRGTGAFERLIESINLLKRKKIKFSCGAVIQENNIKHINFIYEYCKTNDIPLAFSPMIWFGQFVYTEDQVDSVTSFLNQYDLAYMSSRGKYKIKGCHAGKRSCYIDPTGYVYTCSTMGANFEEKRFLMGRLSEYDWNFDALVSSQSAKRAFENVGTCAGCYGACEIHREIKCGNSIIDDDANLFAESIFQEKLNPQNLNVSIKIISIDRHLYPSQKEKIKIMLTNNSVQRFVSTGPRPVNLSYHWKKPHAKYIVFDGLRTPIRKPLYPGESREFEIECIAPEIPGDYDLELTLVQEGCFWFEKHVKRLPFKIKVKIITQ